MIQDTIKKDMIVAMKQKEKVAVQVLRGIMSAFTNELVAQKRTPQDTLSDAEAIGVIRRLAKQHNDSIRQYQEGGREDLAKEETEELTIISRYLPQMMPRDEIKKLALAKRAELALNNPSQKGLLIGALMKTIKDVADGSDVKSVVDEIFSE